LAVLIGIFFLGLTAPAGAHFLVLRPSSDVVGPEERSVSLEILFTHPMEQGPIMELGRPERFGVLAGGKDRDLLGQLRPRKIDGKTVYDASIRLERPGDFVFYLQPAPYWEASEETVIVHCTKVVVDFLGVEKGWDAMVGFPVEIEPLVRPYGLWTGNTFRGVVRHRGQPVPWARIEVEYLNEGGKVKAPNDAFVTQVIKADADGVFCYSMPKAGWWGFAALVSGPEKMKGPNGKMVDVELGGVMWIRVVDMK
jgi:cobalt/nickel transport protein